MPYLSPDAKAKLSATIRSLRERLLIDLPNAAESTYRFSIHLFSKKQLEPRSEVEFDPKNKAGLLEEGFQKRLRIEQWLYEQVRAETGGKALKDEKQERAIWDRHLHTAIKLAAATLLNRLIVMRQMEALGLMRYKVVTGGWSSSGYRGFRDFAPDLCKDDTEGYGTLLQLLYDELALEMPGLFGRVGLTELFPISASTLRTVVEELDALDPDTWLDDTTLGWVYQFWNDPERKALDEKIASGGKIENHEIASKTQIFTERYMVEWLLQNSLNQQWLAICKKNGWTPEVEANGTLDALQKRREAWKKQREAGAVSPEEIMPILTEEEHRWKYWMPPLPSEEFVKEIPESIRFLKIFDPAVGSGHFLIIAFTLLTAFYEEEARHLCEDWTPKQIAEWIIENNLHGVDIDPRAVQIAAAALFLKAKAYAKDAAPRLINLVASNFGLASLPHDDPAIVDLKRALKDAIDMPEELTEIILDAIKQADHLGSLLKIDKAVQDALKEYRRRAEPRQITIYESNVDTSERVYPYEKAKESIFENLVEFLERRTSSEDLGLRLRGEQLAAGVRFIQLVRRGEYDLVIANPPYLGADRMANRKYIEANYSISKSDLYAVFLQRGVELVEFAKLRGLSAMITMRGWMFIKEFEALRAFVIPQKTVSRIADLHFGAFPEMKDVSVTMSILVNSPNKQDEETFFLQPVREDLVVRDLNQVSRNISGLLSPYKLFKHHLSIFKSVKGQPFIYWWNDTFFKQYSETPKLGDKYPARFGLTTGNNVRFVVFWWEVASIYHYKSFDDYDASSINKYQNFTPFILGSRGVQWIDPLRELLRWKYFGLEVKIKSEFQYGTVSKQVRNENVYFSQGVAFTTIGSSFSARVHKYPGVISNAASSTFPSNPHSITCLMNSTIGRSVLSALNPTVNFQVGDVNRLPLFPIESADEIFAQLDRAFTAHEAARETSVEFKQPGTSCWNYAQEWAQQAVDRPAGEPLPEWNPVYEEPPAVNWVSYAVGVALGRFPFTPQPPLPNGEGEPSQEFLVPLLPGEKGLGDEGISELAGRERQIPKELLERAKELRKQQTVAEEILWNCLRDRQLQNAKFRRQHNIGQIIADFYCHDAKLIIELDGGIHQQRQVEDRDRDTWAVEQGFTVLRFSNQEVFDQIEKVLEQIAQHLPSSPQPPSPWGEGGAGIGLLPPSPSGRGAGGEGILPYGILYLSTYSGDQPDSKDSLNHPASQPIKDHWNQYGSKIAKNASLRDWLRLNFFKDVHVKLYEQRPIYFPLSSKTKSFVAFVSIHRWTDNTLQTLLADYLMPELSQLEGEVADLLEAKGRGDSKAQAKAEKRYTEILQLRDELKTFISLVQQCAEQGAPKANPKDPDREANARFTMDLDDGVMVNSAALWCLLDPQWNKPKTWWSELCKAQGKKDYDWSHLAARYFPDRVDAKCQIDPSLAVAHGCFWKYHPAKAYEWELRLQDEIAPDFTIDEANSDALRQQFKDKNPERVADLKEKEEKRRERKRKKQDQLEMDFDEGAIEELEEDDES